MCGDIRGFEGSNIDVLVGWRFRAQNGPYIEGIVADLYRGQSDIAEVCASSALCPPSGHDCTWTDSNQCNIGQGSACHDTERVKTILWHVVSALCTHFVSFCDILNCRQRSYFEKLSEVTLRIFTMQMQARLSSVISPCPSK